MGLFSNTWEQWDKALSGRIQAIKVAQSECLFTAEQNDHQQGHFPALEVGISYGGGCKVGHHLFFQRLMINLE